MVGVVVGVGVALTACTGDDTVTPPSTSIADNTTTTIERDDDGILRLGVYLPVTGVGTSLGEPMIGAVTASVDLINAAGGVFGAPVELEIVDEGAGIGPRSLLDGGVDAIVGPASSLDALSQLGELVESASGVVVCSPTATALTLDAFPDNGYFFRTAPSDSLQMTAVATRVRGTGLDSVAVGYLDDPYGRGLADAFRAEADRLRITVSSEVGFSSDQEDLSGAAADVLAGQPGVVVVLGDADDGSRLLAALDLVTGTPPQIIVNDAIRTARERIQSLSPEFRAQLTGVAPLAVSVAPDGPAGFFTAHAADCVNLIALAALAAESDAPSRIRTTMASVSTGGRSCASYATCAGLLDQGLNIDYNGASGNVELSSTTGDPTQAWFESFGFDDTGVETDSQRFEVP